MEKAEASPDLKNVFTTHLEQTRGHIARLEKCFESFNKKAQAKKCEAMDGLVKEGEEAIEEYKQGPGRDAALIVAAQKVEHNEISGYGSLHSFAALLVGYTEAAGLLAQT
jgi:ferritin-like metal-binding protein YciE